MLELNKDECYKNKISMYADNSTWIDVPLIKMGKHAVLREQLNIRGDYAMFSDFFM